MGKAVQLILQYFKKNPDKIAVLGKSAGRSFGSIGQVAKWIKGNPLNATIAAANMGALGLTVLDFLQEDESSPETITAKRIQSIRDKISYEVDDLDEDLDSEQLSLNDIDKYADEIRMIRRVTNRLGGKDALYELRTVLAMPDQYFVLEDAISRIGR